MPGASGGSASGSSTSGTSGNTSGTAGSSGNSSSGTAANPAGNNSSGTASSSTGGAAGSTSGNTASGTTGGKPGGAANTTGSTSTSSTNVNVTTEQRTQITESFRSVNVQPLTNVTFNVSVGTVIPSTVTTLYDCPNTVERILTGLPECKYVVIRDQIVIVEPGSRRIVTVIERRG
jgi:hypothetical protein